MPVNYPTAVKNARLQAVVDLIGTTGLLVIGDNTLNGAAGGVLASIPLDNPSFDIAGGVMTMRNPPRRVDATGAGNAAKAEIRSGAGTVIINGLTVGLAASSPDVVINSLSVSVGQTIQATLGTITSP